MYHLPITTFHAGRDIEILFSHLVQINISAYQNLRESQKSLDNLNMLMDHLALFAFVARVISYDVPTRQNFDRVFMRNITTVLADAATFAFFN